MGVPSPRASPRDRPGGQGRHRGRQLTTRPLGWALAHWDGCPCEKGAGHRGTQAEGGQGVASGGTNPADTCILDVEGIPTTAGITLGDGMLSGMRQAPKDKACTIPRHVRLPQTDRGVRSPGHRVSVWEDEKVLGLAGDEDSIAVWPCSRHCTRTRSGGLVLGVSCHHYKRRKQDPRVWVGCLRSRVPIGERGAPRGWPAPPGSPPHTAHAAFPLWGRAGPRDAGGCSTSALSPRPDDDTRT